VGATLWNSFLLVCGMYLREHWRVIQTHSPQGDIVVCAVLLLGVLYFIKSRYRRVRSDLQCDK
jgi:membrane protein DedA with SNARE-associated domain